MIRYTLIESPYAGDIEANTEYARAAATDCIERGEIPYASHLFFPQILNEDDENDRDAGIRFGYELGLGLIKASQTSCDEHPACICIVAFYADRGWSKGMEEAIKYWSLRNVQCEVRRIHAASADER